MNSEFEIHCSITELEQLKKYFSDCEIECKVIEVATHTRYHNNKIIKKNYTIRLTYNGFRETIIFTQKKNQATITFSFPDTDIDAEFKNWCKISDSLEQIDLNHTHLKKKELTKHSKEKKLRKISFLVSIVTIFFSLSCLYIFGRGLVIVISEIIGTQ